MTARRKPAAEPGGEVQLTAEDLRAVLAAANQGAERKATVPILANVLIAATGGRLTVTGTDMEIHVTASTDADGDLSPATVNAERLMGLVASADSAETATLTMDCDGDALILRIGSLRARLMTLPVEDFPSVTRKRGKAWEVDAAELRRLLTRPAHAISTETARYYLNGIYLHLRQDGATRILAGSATDGHRLFVALADARASAAAPADMPGMIVPRATCGALAALLEGEATGAAVEVTATDNLLSVAGRDWQMDSKLIDGQFPEYDRVIPAPGGTVLHVPAPGTLAKHITTVSIMGEGKAKPVRLGAAEDGLGVTLQGASLDAGEATIDLSDTVAVWEAPGGPPLSIQARYLRDLCAALPNGFRAQIKASDTPALIQEDDAIAVLMPMRV
ncbi:MULTISPECIES: DNA polymerase III subunit beta [Roseomonadaceae]|uniref:DNA polymerase III subunit beta n=1 Tax=Falsiroseomonas oleicola TaxID=2801474 RepID=A0ABS6H6I3_9PROT|nr:DNA polymerase III subunit beta [Roseomonas oleicola]MBU8543966.1 DNA polymerase III subunit beta [Roseomonas oleicola]